MPGTFAQYPYAPGGVRQKKKETKKKKRGGVDLGIGAGLGDEVARQIGKGGTGISMADVSKFLDQREATNKATAASQERAVKARRRSIKASAARKTAPSPQRQFITKGLGEGGVTATEAAAQGVGPTQARAMGLDVRYSLSPEARQNQADLRGQQPTLAQTVTDEEVQKARLASGVDKLVDGKQVPASSPIADLSFTQRQDRSAQLAQAAQERRAKLAEIYGAPTTPRQPGQKLYESGGDFLARSRYATEGRVARGAADTARAQSIADARATASQAKQLGMSPIRVDGGQVSGAERLVGMGGGIKTPQRTGLALSPERQTTAQERAAQETRRIEARDTAEKRFQEGRADKKARQEQRGILEERAAAQRQQIQMRYQTELDTIKAKAKQTPDDVSRKDWLEGQILWLDRLNREAIEQSFPPQGGAELAAQPSQAAIDFLRQNPNEASAFDAKYGQGASVRILQGG